MQSTPSNEEQEKTYLQLLDFAKDLEKQPDVWKEFYPREYKPLPGYPSPKLPACLAAIHRMEMQMGQVAVSTNGGRMDYLLRQWQTPTYFVAPEMLTALDNIDYDQDIDWREMNLPFPAAIFMLPKGGFIHPELGEIAYIEYARFLKGDRIASDEEIMGREPHEIITASNSAFFLQITAVNSETICTALPESLTSFNLRERNHLISEIDKLPSAEHSEFPMVSVGVQFERALRIIINAVEWIEDVPDIVTPSRRLNTIINRGVKREFWAPMIIGKDYKMRVEPAAPGGGHHASPQTPFVVRGHNRMQACGLRLTERKKIRVEPYWKGR